MRARISRSTGRNRERLRLAVPAQADAPHAGLAGVRRQSRLQPLFAGLLWSKALCIANRGLQRHLHKAATRHCFTPWHSLKRRDKPMNEGSSLDDRSTKTNGGGVAAAQSIRGNKRHLPAGRGPIRKAFRKTAGKLGPDHVRQYLLYLFKEKKDVWSTIQVNRGALKFLYVRVLKQRWFDDEIATPKRRVRSAHGTDSRRSHWHVGPHQQSEALDGAGHLLRNGLTLTRTAAPESGGYRWAAHDHPRSRGQGRRSPRHRPFAHTAGKAARLLALAQAAGLAVPVGQAR